MASLMITATVGCKCIQADGNSSRLACVDNFPTLPKFILSSPALLQSTVKLFFCPTKALDSPAPRQTTLLASHISLAEVAEEDEL